MCLPAQFSLYAPDKKNIPASNRQSRYDKLILQQKFKSIPLVTGGCCGLHAEVWRWITFCLEYTCWLERVVSSNSIIFRSRISPATIKPRDVDLRYSSNCLPCLQCCIPRLPNIIPCFHARTSPNAMTRVSSSYSLSRSTYDPPNDDRKPALFHPSQSIQPQSLRHMCPSRRWLRSRRNHVSLGLVRKPSKLPKFPARKDGQAPNKYQVM